MLYATGQMEPGQLAALPVEQARALKTASADMGWMRMRAAEPLAIDDATRTIRYVWSDETVDRYGDIIRADGWDLASYATNPIALYMHDMERPVGTGVDYGVSGGKLVGGIRYAAEGTSEWHDSVWKLARQGILRAVSVGFDPVERVWYDDSEERKALGLGEMGVEYRRQRLLEISAVTIPANPSALQLALRPLVDSGELSDRAATEVMARLTERDWEKRARAIRRSVTVAKPEPPLPAVDAALLARVDTIEHELRELRAAVTVLRAADDARARADVAAADAKAATEALHRATQLIALKRAVDQAIQTVQEDRT